MTRKLYRIAKPIPRNRKNYSLVNDPVPGTLGGNEGTKLYGRLDCPTALRYVAKGTYQKNRVFFHNEEEAIACGFRPCAHCLPEKYAAWKASQAAESESTESGGGSAPPSPPSQRNLFEQIPADLPQELVEVIAEGSGSFRLERIVSRGHSSPADFWYEQESTEWVSLLSGSALLRFENHTMEMVPGDWLEIPPLVRHRVESTSTIEATVWLALHWE